MCLNDEEKGQTGGSKGVWDAGDAGAGGRPGARDDVALGFGTVRRQGGFVGSAAIVGLSAQDKARDAALNMLRFFEDESCGQCTPCRVGCEKAVKLMQADKWDQGLLSELCEAMMDASICGLGQAAPNPILLTMKYFGDEV